MRMKARNECNYFLLFQKCVGFQNIRNHGEKTLLNEEAADGHMSGETNGSLSVRTKCSPIKSFPHFCAQTKIFHILESNNFKHNPEELNVNIV